MKKFKYLKIDGVGITKEIEEPGFPRNEEYKMWIPNTIYLERKVDYYPMAWVDSDTTTFKKSNKLFDLLDAFIIHLRGTDYREVKTFDSMKELLEFAEKNPSSDIFGAIWLRTSGDAMPILNSVCKLIDNKLILND